MMRAKTVSLILVLFVSAFVLAVACGESDGDDEKRTCRTVADCQGGEICSSTGYCQTMTFCTSDAACEYGQYCTAGKYCEVARECTNANECDAGFDCIDSFCLPKEEDTGCKSSDDCAFDEYCDTTTGECERRAPTDGDTPDGDTPDGDTPDGDTPDGDTPDGDTPDGDTPDGDTPDGDTPDGDSDGDSDSETPDGDTPDDTTDVKFCETIAANQIGYGWMCLVVDGKTMQANAEDCSTCETITANTELTLSLTDCNGSELTGGALDPLDPANHYAFVLMPDGQQATLTILRIPTDQATCDQVTYQDVLNNLSKKDSGVKIVDQWPVVFP